MDDITAVDARHLQKTGVAQDEYMGLAIQRCNNAIVDVSRNRQESSVSVLVSRLNPESLEVVAEDLRARGFDVKTEYGDFRSSVLTISWEEGNA